MSKVNKQPPISWAQRSDNLYLSINIPDAKDIKASFEESSMKFQCKSDESKETYEVDITFFKDIVKSESEWRNTGRVIEFKIAKKDKESEYWPRYYKEKAKLPNVSIDWSRYVDEDEEKENNVEFEGGSGVDNMQGFDPSQFDPSQLAGLQSQLGGSGADNTQGFDPSQLANLQSQLGGSGAPNMQGFDPSQFDPSQLANLQSQLGGLGGNNDEEEEEEDISEVEKDGKKKDVLGDLDDVE